MTEAPNHFENFISGGVGGVCTVLTGHPLDTIKVRLQTSPVPRPGESPLYKGTWDCAKKTVAKEGFRGLYKGMGAPLTGVAPVFAISFMGYGLGKKLQQKNQDDQLTLIQLFYAGGFSGIFTTSILAPGERIKCLLQVQHNQGTTTYNGPVDCAKKLYKQGGIRSIYKGTGLTLLRDIPSSGVYFMTYDGLKRFMSKDDKPPGVLATIFAGGCAGITNWIVGMPPDVLKSRFQAAPEGTYKSIGDVFKVLIHQEGPLALYKGVVPVMLRAFPANAACFVGFELSVRIFKWSSSSSASL